MVPQIVYTYVLRGAHTLCRTADGEKYLNPHIFPTFPVEAIDMKRSLLIALCVVFCSSMAFAQAGSIMLFSDPGATTCDLYDMPGIMSVFVFHMYTPGATGAQFMVDHWSWGAGAWIWISDTPIPPPGVYIGNSQTGIQIGYSMCIFQPTMILRIDYFVPFPSPPCSYIQVVGHPTATPPGILVADCAVPSNLLTATGGDVVVNPNASCMCSIPVEETTWGQVKALYQ